MEHNGTRREFLAATATSTAAALGGCSGLLTGGATPESAVRRWIYAPSNYENAEIGFMDITHRAPASLHSDASHLHPSVPASDVERVLDSELVEGDVEVDVDPEAIDYSVQLGNPYAEGPKLFVNGGSFDEEAARDLAALQAFPSADTGHSFGDVGDFELLTYSRSNHGAVRDGEAASIYARPKSEARKLVENATNGSSLPSDLPDAVRGFLQTVGFDDVTRIRFTGLQSGGFGGEAFSYSVSGETTTVRWVSLRTREQSVMERRTERVDALRDVSIETDGEVVSLSGTVDSDQTALDGRMFLTGRAPFESKE